MFFRYCFNFDGFSPMEAESMKFTIFFPFNQICYIPKLVKSKLKMFKSLRPTHDGRKQMTICQTSNSGT